MQINPLIQIEGFSSVTPQAENVAEFSDRIIFLLVYSHAFVVQNLLNSFPKVVQFMCLILSIKNHVKGNCFVKGQGTCNATQ